MDVQNESWFSRTVKYRTDIPVSKRMRENGIKQIFKKDKNNKKEIETISYLLYGSDQVAKLEISKETTNYGQPIIEMIINELYNIEKVLSRKSYLSQEKAIHDFLDYWETKTKEGREKNKEFKLRKY